MSRCSDARFTAALALRRAPSSEAKSRERSSTSSKVYNDVVPDLAKAVVAGEEGASEDDLERLYEQTLVILSRAVRGAAKQLGWGMDSLAARCRGRPRVARRVGPHALTQPSGLRALTALLRPCLGCSGRGSSRISGVGA